MKITTHTSIFLIFLILLAGCGPKDTPDNAAYEWTTAMLTNDGNKLAERTCSEQISNVQSTALFTSFIEIIGQQAIDQKLEVDLKDLNFSVFQESGSSAIVQVKGVVRSAVLAVFQITPVDTKYNMVKEDGKWKWCGEIVSNPAIIPGSLPIESEPSIEAKNLLVIPVEVIKEEPHGGWNNYRVKIAIENPLGNPSDPSLIPGLFPYEYGYKLSLTEGTVQTEEEYTYETEGLKKEGSYGLVNANAVYIPDHFPPGFRFLADEQIVFRAAETVHPTAIGFSTFTIDLKDISQVYFPTDLPNASFSDLTEEILIPNRIRIQFTGFVVNETGYPSFSYSIESLNVGQDEEVNTVCFTWDNFGNINSNINPWFDIGPGQKDERTLNFGANALKLDSASISSRYLSAKLVCDGDVNKILNFGYSNQNIQNQPSSNLDISSEPFDTENPNPPPSSRGEPFIYYVQSGDTLETIAQKFNVDPIVLAKLNILDPIDYSLHEGDLLAIPVPNTSLENIEFPSTMCIEYQITFGDNYFAIAQYFNTTVDAIIAANNLIDETDIQIGQILCIPVEVKGPD